jgi:hypothetical protein
MDKKQFIADMLAGKIPHVEVIGIPCPKPKPECETNSLQHIGKERPRKIYQIAGAIFHNWKKVNYAAKPYLDAMLSLSDIDDKYMMDDARSIIRYFLCNAGSWRGPVAKAIKAELKAML